MREAIRNRPPNYWRVTGGMALLVLGVVGLFLPVLQGSVLLMLALMVLSADIRLARQLRLRIERRFPRLRRTVRRGRHWMYRWWRPPPHPTATEPEASA